MLVRKQFTLYIKDSNCSIFFKKSNEIYHAFNLVVFFQLHDRGNTSPRFRLIYQGSAIYRYKPATLLCMSQSMAYRSYVVVFLMFNDFRWAAMVCFVDIGEFVDHHCLNVLLFIILYIPISRTTFAHALSKTSTHIGKSQCHLIIYMTYCMWQHCRHEYTCSWCTVHWTFNYNQSIKYFQLFSLYIVILL